jgi:hypothetical protein
MSEKLHKVEARLQKTNQALEEALREAEALEAGMPVPESPPKKAGSARGIETMFRTAYRVQMDLTDLADNKANMMMSINGIIISIILAAVAPKLDTNPWLLLPTVILLLGTLVSMVYAIMAARPRVSSEPITLSDLKRSQGNILFFGNFANLSEQDFVEGMEELMEQRDLLYETMVRNIYGIGSVLRKKFALLQIAYTAFMTALILGVLSFIGVFVWILQRAS